VRRNGAPGRRPAALAAAPFLLAPLVLLVGGPSPSAARGAPVEEGRRLYQAHCASCHGEEARGTAQAPGILGLGPAVYDFQLSTGRMPLARPGVQPFRKPPVFDREEIDALVAYLTSLAPGGIPIPRVDPEAGDLSVGQAVYQANCAACHGATGIGGAVGRGYAPDLFRATPTQIAEAVRIGPGAMPPFGPDLVPEDRLDSLVRYVLFLRDPPDRGGAGLGHVGPIVEGFVAILAGLGAVVAVARFAGERG
jgi:ubiquinol-cytochrome c reductase cytochrome c subunit